MKLGISWFEYTICNIQYTYNTYISIQLTYEGKGMINWLLFISFSFFFKGKIRHMVHIYVCKYDLSNIPIMILIWFRFISHTYKYIYLHMHSYKQFMSLLLVFQFFFFFLYHRCNKGILNKTLRSLSKKSFSISLFIPLLLCLIY